MLTKLLAPAIALGFAALMSGGPVQDTVPPAAPGYAWADACQKCHQPVYDAWSHTKHASALDRLTGSEQEQPCGPHFKGFWYDAMKGLVHPAP